MTSTAGRLVQGSFLRVLTLVANIAVGFFLMPFLIHALGDRWYGLWTLVGSIMVYYGLLDLGVGRAVGRFLTRALAREEDKQANVIMVTGLGIAAAAGAVAFLVSVGVAAGAPWFIADPGEAGAFRQVVLILGADVALAFPFAAFNAVLSAHYRFDIQSFIELAGLAVRTALIVYFVGQGHSIVALALIAFGVNLASRIAILAAARRLIPGFAFSRTLFDLARARQLFGYGKYAFVTVSADRIRFQIDTLIVAAFLNVALVTHYAIAARITQLFMQLMLHALGVVGPLFVRVDAQGDLAETRRMFLLTTRVSAVAAVTVAGGIAILGERFIELWVGGSYDDAYWPMVILTASLTFDLMQMPSVAFLYASARHKFYAGLNAGEALANLGLSVMLVQHYGMIGVALGTAIPLLATRLILQPRYVCRALELGLRAYYLELGRVALIAALSQMPLLVYVQIFGASSLLTMLVLALGYYPICWMLLYRGILPPSDRRRIGSAVPALRWLPL